MVEHLLSLVGCGGQLVFKYGTTMIGQDSVVGSLTEEPGLGQGGVLTDKGGGGGIMGL